jgi:signal transduction histidine kinase
MGMPSRLTAPLANAWRVRHSAVALDVGLGLAVATSTAIVALRSAGHPEGVSWWIATVAAVAAQLVRHRLPVLTFAVGTLATLGHLASGAGPMPVDVVALIGLFSVAAVRSRRLSLALLTAGLVAAGGWALYASEVNTTVQIPTQVRVSGDGVAIVPPRGYPEPPVAPEAPPADEVVVGTATLTIGAQVPTWGGFPLSALALVLAWLAGRSAHERRARLAGLERRAEELERERDTQAALAVAAERGRISRELHDVVAHALSVVVLQAQGGEAELTHRPERTREALSAIVETGRTALRETRRLLGALGHEAPDWAPQPGAEQLPHLVAQVRATGTPVRLHVEGRPRPLPSTVDLAAYRIAQEALTNVMKHAGPDASAAIVVRYTPEALQIEVTDDGSAIDRPDDDELHTGHGLRGMRERVTVLDGTFEAGPRPERGFVVEASLPLPEARP